jgi:hypothetical protein
VLIDFCGAAEHCVQYNPDTLSRTLQVQAIAEGGDRSEAMRLKGPAVGDHQARNRIAE